MRAQFHKITGSKGENRACKWLESKGFIILARNYSTQGGEIDIIALRKQLSQDALHEIHCIEVKTFRHSVLSPRYAITPKKLQKIYKSIDALLFTCHAIMDSLKDCATFIPYATFTNNKTQASLANTRHAQSHNQIASTEYINITNTKREQIDSTMLKHLPNTQATHKAYAMLCTLQKEHINLHSCTYCVDAVLIWQDNVEFVENISME